MALVPSSSSYKSTRTGAPPCAMHLDTLWGITSTLMSTGRLILLAHSRRPRPREHCERYQTGTDMYQKNRRYIYWGKVNKNKLFRSVSNAEKAWADANKHDWRQPVQALSPIVGFVGAISPIVNFTPRLGKGLTVKAKKYRKYLNK